MKKILQLLFLLVNHTVSNAQQFSFQMNFVDSLGSSDSLILGYDNSATDSIDAAFVEINIAPWFIAGNAIEVRCTDLISYQVPYYSFATKKQIVKNHCGLTGVSIIEIDIHTANWPITATWNNSLFNDSCRNGSLFTSINPSGWWNTGSPSNLGIVSLLNDSQVIFTRNSPVSTCDTNFCSWLVDGNFIWRYWLVFGDSTLFPNSISENVYSKQRLSISPNPSDSKFNILIPKAFGDMKMLEIYSSEGRLLEISYELTTLDLAAFENGIYFIVVTNQMGEKLTAIAMKI